MGTKVSGQSGEFSAMESNKASISKTKEWSIGVQLIFFY